VSNYSDNVTYVWYVNGDAKGTGSSFAFDNSWTQGYYRIDVTAFSADGKRAGSATTNVQVVAPVAVPVVVVPADYTSSHIGTLKGVPAGSFQRDATAENISMVSAFRMSQYEITRAQFLAIMGTDPTDPIYSTGMSDPVQGLNWYEAVEFCNKLSAAEGLTEVYTISGRTPATGYPITAATVTVSSWTASGYRLPTDMEWMWSAMGATSDSRSGDIVGGVNTGGYTKKYAGSTQTADDISSLRDYAWYSFNVPDRKSKPVGSKLPNELGFYDMSGNVWEFTWDLLNTIPEGTLMDYRGGSLGITHSIHGGSWDLDSSNCPVTFRVLWSQNERGGTNGFRVVRR